MVRRIETRLEPSRYPKLSRADPVTTMISWYALIDWVRLQRQGASMAPVLAVRLASLNFSTPLRRPPLLTVPPLPTTQLSTDRFQPLHRWVLRLYATLQATLTLALLQLANEQAPTVY